MMLLKNTRKVEMLKAVITGVAGQDGSYLAELLLEKGYIVIGITRRKSVDPCTDNINHLIDNENLKLVHGDITDSTLISRILHAHKPHEFYNLAAMSHVGQSFAEPSSTFRVNAESVVIQLELINQISPSTRYYQASTSELFGGISCPPEGYSEGSPFHPRSPYGVAKLAAYWAVRNAREAYGLFACNGILHNHSSPRRGKDFATRKITRGVASVKLGLSQSLKMGNLSPYRDEGHAKDYVMAMHLMLQKEEPEDYLIATGDGATIQEMFEYVCELAGLKFEDVYEEDARFMRPSDVQYLKGNPLKANTELGWMPEYNWKDLLKEMYLSDLRSLQDEKNQE
jgi:GDPmannose 4,6-dehydratase